MALNLSTISPKSWSQHSTPFTNSLDQTRCFSTGFRSNHKHNNNIISCYGLVESVTKIKKEKVFRVKCASLETLGTETENLVGKVTEVNKDTFWPIVHAVQDKTLVLDMYTQWCGPCKVMAPKFEKLAQENLDVIFLKLDCNQENKALAKELGIRVVPTFKVLRESKIVKEVTGAKFEDLVKAIHDAQSNASLETTSSEPTEEVQKEDGELDCKLDS